MWVAKCSINNTIVSKEFDSIYDCQKFIDNNLQILEYLCSEFQHYIDNALGIFKMRFSRYIRCWNVVQNRWCDGFDF